MPKPPLFAIDRTPLYIVPPSSVTKTSTSTAFSPFVSSGASFSGHLTDAGHVVVYASLVFPPPEVSSKIKPVALSDVGGFEKVQVQLSV